jgi:DNA repair exonuclease SbcCD nuclease subunit
MDEITIVWRSDAHLADEPPQSRTDNWTDTILEKIVQVGEIARSVKANAVLDGGDFFHIKSPIRNSHALVQRVIEAHKNYPCPVYVNIGNHDVKYGDMKFLDESPLGVLFSSGVFKRLYDDKEVLLRVGDLSVRVVGIPYHGTKYDMSRFTSINKGTENWLVANVHCLASIQGGTMFEAEDVIRYSDLMNTAPDIYAFGHSHNNQGVTGINGKQFVNIGGLSRGTISQDDVERIPECAIMRFTQKEVKIERRPLVVKPSKEVLDILGKVKKEAREMTMEAFVESLKDSLQARKDESLLELIQDIPDVPQEVRERALSYLEKAGAR